jgi:threonine aldolase
MYDFYSDTKTKPTEAMLRTVLSAEVGDEQKGEDPTTNALCERVAEMLGKEAAVFLPSGTMCNQVAVRVHIQPSDEVICERTCHIVNSEGGAVAAYSGAMVHPIDGRNGTLEPAQVKAAIRAGTRHQPRSRLLCVEQTANLAGGAVWPLERLQAVCGVAREAGLATHMDGARLMNAVVKTGISANTWASNVDSCWIDFSKGLGAPVGAALAGSRDFIDRAWRVKQQFGGAMRQSGVLAALCLYALDHNIDRLAEDHALAATIAERLGSLRKISNILPVETNIIIFDLADDAPTARELVELCHRDGLIIGAFGERRIRVVTHLDVDPKAAEALCRSLDKHLS